MSATSDTLTGTTDPLREARAHTTRTLNDAHQATEDARDLAQRAGEWLPVAIFQDPSRLGAHRARLQLARDYIAKGAGLIAEVGADVADLTWRPGVDSGEEG